MNIVPSKQKISLLTERLEVTNRSTEHDMLVVSRLVLQKILCSDSIEFMEKKSYNDLQKLLLSETPQRELCVTYVLNDDDFHSSSDVICTLSVRWNNTNQVLDFDGNVWQNKLLFIKPVISSSFFDDHGYEDNDLHASSLKLFKHFQKRVSCLSSVAQLAQELHDLVPNGLAIKIMDNEQRMKIVEVEKYDIACRVIAELVKNNVKLRNNLRKGGAPRIRRKDEAFSKFECGIYTIEVNLGSLYRKKIIKYCVEIDESSVSIRKLT